MVLYSLLGCGEANYQVAFVEEEVVGSLPFPFFHFRNTLLPARKGDTETSRCFPIKILVFFPS